MQPRHCWLLVTRSKAAHTKARCTYSRCYLWRSYARRSASRARTLTHNSGRVMRVTTRNRPWAFTSKPQNRRMWTAEEDAFLAEQYGKIPAIEIAEKLDRTRDSVLQHAAQKNLGTEREGWTPRKKPVVRLRPCLSCGEEFKSQHRHNRLCKRCSKKISGASIAPGWTY